MAAALERLQVKGYKSIRDMDLTLKSLNVLIGANGAGKTNFISIFRLLKAIADQRLQEFVARSGGANSLLYFGNKRTDEIHLELEFGENLYEATLKADDNDALYFGSEYAYVWDRNKYDRPYRVSLGTGQRESHLRSSTGAVAVYARAKIDTWQLYHFHDTTSSARVKGNGDLSDNRVLKSDASILGAYLLLLRKRHHETYQQIVDVIRLVAPFFDDFVLKPNAFDETKIRLEWLEKGSDASFGPNDLSDGTLRFICLATALLQPTPPAAILIDEPELGLHPYAITLLAGLMRTASLRMQVIVSTQSVPLVNQFVVDDLVVVDRRGEQSTFQRLDNKDLKNWLDEYGLGELWEKNVLGGRPTLA